MPTPDWTNAGGGHKIFTEWKNLMAEAKAELGKAGFFEKYRPEFIKFY